MAKKQRDQIKSKQRVKAHGEVFTAEREVNAMLDLVQDEVERIESKFLEPAAGTGNFLTGILERKLRVATREAGGDREAWERLAMTAVANLYGIEFLQDNLAEAKARLLSLVKEQFESLFPGSPQENFLSNIRLLLERNIVWGDTLKMTTPDGQNPIVFSDWEFRGDKAIRRDFLFKDLVEDPEGNRPFNMVEVDLLFG